MPAYMTGLPVGASALKITANGVDYNLVLGTETFTRAGEDGNVVILPLNGGCEFVGEVLPAEFRKAWDANIDTFTARINGEDLELTGVATIAGTQGNGWINNHHPFVMMNDIEFTVEIEVPLADTGGVANRDVFFEFYLRQDQAVDDPAGDDNFLMVRFNIDEDGLLMELQREIGGANVTLWDGSTADGNSARSDTGDQFWIFRFQFQDGVAGAASPQDVKHLHVFAKHGTSRANAEAATEEELFDTVGGQASPYDISGLLYDVGYFAYRIGTANTTYFGTAIGSADRVESAYLRVEYPSLFSLKYDFADADVGKGDVELWDGDPDVATSQRVFDEDHVFVNDPYIQNGLIRLFINEGATDGLSIRAYLSGAWTNRTNIHRYSQLGGSNCRFPFIRSITQVSLETVVLQVRQQDSTVEDDDFFVDLEVELNRGSYYAKITVIDSLPILDIEIQFSGTPADRFGYAGDDDIGDNDLNITASNTTLTDNFSVSFDDAGMTSLIIIFSNQFLNTARIIDDGRTHFLRRVDTTDIGTFVFYITIIPFSLVANLFIEAEDATRVGGATIEADGAASGGQTVEMNAQNETNYYEFNAGTDLPEGRYIAVFRLRDTNQVAGDVGLRVRNTTAGQQRNEENVYNNITITAAYLYYGIVFDITAADVSGTDNLRIQVNKQTAGANSIFNDYFLVIPIGDGESFPQDLSHAAMRVFDKPRRVFVR